MQIKRDLDKNHKYGWKIGGGAVIHINYIFLIIFSYDESYVFRISHEFMIL